MNRILALSNPILLGCIAVWLLTLLMLNRLPGHTELHPRLMNQPVQVDAPLAEFHFYYKDQDIHVIPKATYEIAGLVVSHNNPAKWYSFDITHDELSLDTLDLCLLWGKNLSTNDFHRVSFRNDDWACVWHHGRDVTEFNPHELSNNHLITANDDIRARIAHLMVGDQVLIRGKLTDYSEARWGPGRARHSSMNREDKGNGACEIILVEELEVLRSHNRMWAAINALAYWLAVANVVIRTVLFWMPSRRNRRVRSSQKPTRWGIH